MKIVDWIDQANAKNHPPEPVDNGTSEEWIFPPRHPVDECGSRALLVLPLGLAVVEKRRRDGSFRVRDQQFTLTQGFTQGAARGAFDAAEKCGQTPKLIAAPFAKRMVVTLGALQVDTQE